MTALNFLLTRAFARTLRAGDEIVVTKLDHDANVAPWLELAHDLGIVVRVAGSPRSSRSTTRISRGSSRSGRASSAFPLRRTRSGPLRTSGASSSSRTTAGALAWADAVHYGPHGPIDVAAWDVDVLICSPYKFFGPHLGLAFGKQDLLESWRPYKVRPAAERAGGPPLRARDAPARAARGLRRGRGATSTRSAGTRSRPTRPHSASGFSTGFPTLSSSTACGR